MLSRDLWNTILQQTAADMIKMMNPKTVVRFLHELGYRGRAARLRSHFFALSTLSVESNGGSEMISKPLEFWYTVIFVSPGLHSFLTAVESGSGSFHPKSFLCGICSQ